MDLSAAQIIELLGLKRHSTCGFVDETFSSPIQLPASALPQGYTGTHSLGNVLTFLVTPEACVRLHRIRSDQMYHHYCGDPLEVLLLYADGRHEVKAVGSDLRAGMRPQLFIPGGTFHTARVTRPEGWALLGTSVWVRAEAADVETGDVERLASSFPKASAVIREFAVC
jgi:predicted cupin superfamily sugar epimerase